MNWKLLFLLTLFVINPIKALPISSFFTNEGISAITLSPSGEYVAVVRHIKDAQLLVVINVSTKQESILVDTQRYFSKETDLRAIKWIDNRYIALHITGTRTGIEGLLDTKAYNKVLFVDSQSPESNIRILSVRTKGWIVDSLNTVKREFLYAKSSLVSKLYKINVEKLQTDDFKLGKLDRIDGGQFVRSNEVARTLGYAIRWFVQDNGQPVSVLALTNENKLVLNWIDNEQAKPLFEWSFDEDKGLEENDSTVAIEQLIPIAIADNSKSYYCLDIKEDKSKTVYRVDYSSKTFKKIYQTQALNIVNLIFNQKRELVGINVLKNGQIIPEYLNGKQVDLIGDEKGNPVLAAVLDFSADYSTQLVYTESINNPGTFTIIRKDSESVQIVGYSKPSLTGKLNARLIEGVVKSDSFTIPYLLALPESSGKEKIPLVVMPHGGPVGVYDHRYFDVMSAILIDNGFAVLRVEFRGSGGYSTEFEEASVGEWGTGMIRDIHAALMKVKKNSAIDSNHICTMGFSYGGFASLMLLIDYPDLFQCGVSISGLTDLNLFINSPYATKKQRKWIVKQMGLMGDDYDKIKHISPIYRTKEITKPLFIGHGLLDKTVDVEHTYRLSMMLDKFDRPHQFYIDPDSDHQFDDNKNMKALFERLLEFLNNY